MHGRRLLAFTAVAALVVACGTNTPSAALPTTAAVATASPAETTETPASTSTVSAGPAATASSVATPAPTERPKDVLAGDHPPISANDMQAAFEAAIAAGTSDSLDPGTLAAMPRLLKNCVKPPDGYAYTYTQDAARRCLILAGAANNIYRDTGDKTWYTAASAAVSYLWNIKPRKDEDQDNAKTVLGNMKGGGEAAMLLGAARPTDPVPVRKSVIDIPHRKTSWSAVLSSVNAAIKAEPPVVSKDGAFTPSGLKADIKACPKRITNFENLMSITGACLRIATYAYLNYLVTGSETWYAAARAAVGYNWTHDYNSGYALADLPEMRFRQREMPYFTLLTDYPEFLGQAP